MPSVQPLPQSLLYERVAQRIETQIKKGTLRTNDRIPSVRNMSRTAGVSVATVVQAYVHLESAGLIASRPQSGFYVRADSAKQLPQPKARSVRALRPRSVASEVLDCCREALLRTDIVPLNGAFTSPALYPTTRLNTLIREVMRDHPWHAGEIIAPPGHEGLRRELAKRMSMLGTPTDASEVVITNGTMDALTLTLGVLCRHGDTVLVEAPTYFGILQAVEHLGLKLVEVPNHPGTGIDVEAVRRAVRSTKITAAVLMPNFNNPVGSLTPDDAKREIVAVLTGQNVPIVEDDIYGDLHYTGARPSSLRSFDEAGLVVSCGSISKTIALGFRLGWAVSSQFHEDITRAKFFSSVASPTLQQLVMARYYSGGGYERYLRRIRRLLAENVLHMSDAVARYFPAGTKVTRPAGGVVLWVELPQQVDGTELFRTALASRIGTLPGMVFSAKGDFRNYLRLNCGLPWTTTVQRAVQQLGKLASERVS
ncbi:MAG: PLP-dependent aminotransferase family protein [Candidatus Obscuribacterales bacterium]|nr:PLP-dependent aminotransferase family protein [Steroidobacteraceae bacterium]